MKRFREFLTEQSVKDAVAKFADYISDLDSVEGDWTEIVDANVDLTDTNITISASSVKIRTTPPTIIKRPYPRPTVDSEGINWIEFLSKTKDYIDVHIHNKNLVAFFKYYYDLDTTTVDAYGATKKEGQLGNATGLFEQMACVGFFMEDNPYDLDPDKLVEEIRSHMSKTDNGEDFTDENIKAYIDTKQVQMAIQGTQNYIENHAPDGGYKLIHNGIREYYDKMRAHGGYTIPKQKENTADIVLISDGLNINSLFDEDVVISEFCDAGGYLTVTENEDKKGWVLQVSLKIAATGSQVGKQGKDYKQLGHTQVDYDGKSVTRKAASIKSLKKRLKLEGWLGDIFKSGVGFVKKSISVLTKVLSGLVSKLSKITKSLVKYLSVRVVKKQYESEVAQYIKKLRIRENLHEAKKMTDTQAIDAISDSNEGKKLVCEDTTEALEKLWEVIKPIHEEGPDRFKVRLRNYNLNGNSYNKVDKNDIRNLICNKVAFGTLESFYRTIQNTKTKDGSIFDAIAKYTIDIGINTLMGESLLPVLKLYGTSETSGNWEVLDRKDEKYVEAQRMSMASETNKNPIPVGAISINRSQQSNSEGSNNGYFSVEQYTLAKYEEGKAYYNVVQLRTGGNTGGFQYTIEANSQVTKDIIIGMNNETPN